MTRGRSGVVSMITTFSGAAVRSEISEAGKFSLDQYQRPSPACRTWPSSARNASRSSAGPGPNTSPGSNGSSNVAARRWASRTWRLSGSSAGLLGRRLEEELRVVDDVLVDRRRRGDEHRDAASRRAGPARPICCQVAAIEPG